MVINYERLVRVLTRCAQVAAAAGPTSIIGIVYQSKAEAPIKAFLAADTAVKDALSAYAKENKEGLAALVEMDGPYRVARSAVAAVLPQEVLPDTLKTQPTDTDKLNAIERLLDIIDDHVGTPWADTLLAGDFGKKVPPTVKELNESIAANNAHTTAVMARAAAYGPAYESYLPFKRVVRDVLGPASKEYRRIHLRASPGSSGADDETPEGEGGGAPVPVNAGDAGAKGGQPPA